MVLKGYCPNCDKETILNIDSNNQFYCVKCNESILLDFNEQHETKNRK